MTADERRALKAAVDRQTRDGLSERYDDPIVPKRPSNNPNGKPSFLTEDDVQRLYCMYQATSLRKVASLVWKFYGFKNEHSCQTAIHKAFKRRGFAMHPVGDPRIERKAA